MVLTDDGGTPMRFYEGGGAVLLGGEGEVDVVAELLLDATTEQWRKVIEVVPAMGVAAR